MKLKKILSGFLAAAMAVTSMVTASITAWAEDTVLGKKLSSGDIPVAELTDAVSVKVAFTITTLDSSAYATLKVCMNGGSWKEDTFATATQYASGTGQSWQAKHEVTAQGDQETTLEFSPANWGYEIYLTTDNVDGIAAEMKKVEFLNSSGQVVATYDPNAPVINSDNFTISPLSNDSMSIGDTFTIAYDKTKTPDTAKYRIKVGICDDASGNVPNSAYLNVTNDDGEIIQDAIKEKTGMTVASAVSGNVTTYTFTAASAPTEKFGFKLSVEYSAAGDYSDTGWVWKNGLGVYKVNAVATHTITIDPDIEHGTITADKAEAAKGDKVTLTITPETGYELDTLSVRGANTETGTLNHAFTMPDEDVTVTATFKLKEVALTGITLDKQTASLLVGATTKLTATKTPANTTDTTAITWTSSDTAVATVAADGTVTAKAAGTATITATCGEKTATCAVTVTADAKPCTGITLDETAEVTKGKTVTLTATAAPADTTDEITWSSDTPAVATVSATGVVTGVARGTAKITATCGEKTATCEISVTEDKTVTPPVSVGGQKSYDVVTTAADGTKVKTVDTVYSITEADLQCKGYEVTITNGSNGKSITKTITNAYKNVTVKSAEDLGNDTFTGYFLVVRVKNVPENVTLSYSFKKIS